MTLLSELKHEPITHLDLSQFCKVHVDATVQETLAVMRESGRSCAIVLDAQGHDRPVGVVTDRDVLRRVVDRPDLWGGSVRSIMTTPPHTIGHQATAAEAMSLMDRYHFRNLPVVDANGALLGNFTYASLLRFLADQFPADIYNRPPDAQRAPRRRHGA